MYQSLVIVSYNTGLYTIIIYLSMQQLYMFTTDNNMFINYMWNRIWGNNTISQNCYYNIILSILQAVVCNYDKQLVRACMCTCTYKPFTTWLFLQNS